MKELDDYVERLSEAADINATPVSMNYKIPKRITTSAYNYLNRISATSIPRYIETLAKYRIKESSPISYVRKSIQLFYYRIIPLSYISDAFKEMMEDLNEDY